MRQLLLFAMFCCLATTAHAFDLPGLGLFCQGNCNYVGQWTYNDPNFPTTSNVTATATGNLGGNSGDISGSLFTQCGGTCHYSLVSDPGCLSPAYSFTFAGQCGCAPSGNIFHFCYQSGGSTCQETFSGSWNATASLFNELYLEISMQSDLVVQNANGQCPAGRPNVITLDLASVILKNWQMDCDGNLNSKGLPVPPYYCNENYNVVAPSNENGNPITGNLNAQGDSE